MEHKTKGIVAEARNDMRGNYLVVEACEEGGYKEEMLKNSKIPGLLNVMGQDFNGRHELWYETTGMQPLKASFKQKAPGTEEITELMKQMECLAVRLEEYLLEPEELVLELAYIFEEEGGRYLFLYLPGYDKASCGGLYRLLEEMMEYVDYENHRSVSFLYLLHARSRQQTCGIFSLHRLCKEILEDARVEEQRSREDAFLAEMSEPGGGELKKSRLWKRETEAKRGESAEAERKQRKAETEGKRRNAKEDKFYRRTENKGLKRISILKESGGLAEKISALRQKLFEYIKGESKAEEEFSDEIEEGEREYGREETNRHQDTVLLSTAEMTETILLTEGTETVLLQEQERCMLEPVEDGRESILLDTFPFGVGKEKISCNYVLSEAVISRRHAQILHEGAHYYLVDTKSLNGTYLNGERISAGEKKEIRSGDLIGFADICFIFTCSKAPNGI